MKRRANLGFLAIGGIAAALTAVSFREVRHEKSEEAIPVPAQAAPAPETVAESLSIRQGDTFGNLLVRAGIDGADKTKLIEAVAGTFDVRKFRAGSALTLIRSESGTLEALEYAIDPDRRLQLSRSEDTFQASIVDVPGIIRAVPLCASLQGSLFETLQAAGESPELAIQMAEIFAWDLDFYTDPRQGDEFCILVEKKEYLDGQAPTNRRVLAATYNNGGTLYDAHLFPDPDGKPQYYSGDGRSLQAAFLRSPLKFEARVSSRFSRSRFHPVLKRYRPHLGTDYAAPAGTPVQSVASGRVVFSGRSGGAGNMVTIQHANGFESRYLHLSRRFVRAGERVEQGQRIGLVGSTGLATGPHLDFRLRKAGQFVDFERLKPPRATSVAGEHRAAFQAARDQYLALLQPRFATEAAVAADIRSLD